MHCCSSHDSVCLLGTSIIIVFSSMCILKFQKIRKRKENKPKSHIELLCKAYWAQTLSNDIRCVAVSLKLFVIEELSIISFFDMYEFDTDKLSRISNPHFDVNSRVNKLIYFIKCVEMCFIAYRWATHNQPEHSFIAKLNRCIYTCMHCTGTLHTFALNLLFLLSAHDLLCLRAPFLQILSLNN